MIEREITRDNSGERICALGVPGFARPAKANF